MADDKIDLKEIALSENVLNYFRSFNFLFTLSVLPQSVLKETGPALEKALKEHKSKYVIASSKGKGSNQSLTAFENTNITEQDTSNMDRNDRLAVQEVRSKSAKDKVFLDEYNKTSEGRFDLFFEDVRLESTLSSDQATGFSRLTSLNFNLIEPYSLGGFFKALAATALSAGYENYKTAFFLFTVEFIGYSDQETNSPDGVGVPVQIEPATRFYPIGFNSIQIKADTNGTKYECKAHPMGDLALGNPNTLKTSLKISGKTVNEMLTNMMDSLNKIEFDNANNGTSYNNNPDPSKQNVYKIKFPVRDDSGSLDFNTENVFAHKSTIVADLSKDNIAYEFKDPTETPSGRIRYIPDNPSVQFHSGSNIHDCITAIIRDCNVIQQIFSDFKNQLDDKNMGLVNYFLVGVEAVPSEKLNPQTNTKFFTYTYYVIPYQIHYSRILSFENTLLPITTELVNRRVRRKYHYLYTGKNSNVLNFNIKFDYLFYQIDPFRDGNQPLLQNDKNKAAVGSENVVFRKTELTDDEKAQAEQVKKDGLIIPITTLQDPNLNRVQYAGQSTRPLQASPYANFVKALHTALMENSGMKVVDIEILGDPFYLLQCGIGNQRPKTMVSDDSVQEGITENGVVDHLIGDTYILIQFKTPVDAPDNEGAVQWSNVLDFSGIYRINKVSSSFRDGVFKQTLNCVMMPNPYLPGEDSKMLPSSPWKTEKA